MNFGDVKNLKEIKLTVFCKNIIESWVIAGGGCMDEPKSFADIRKQILWGNQFIKWNRKCLLYKTWIDDNILYINDIISPAGEIDTALILQKLHSKQNWISEIYKLKRAIPEAWKNKLKSRTSRETAVQTKTDFFLNDIYCTKTTQVFFGQVFFSVTETDETIKIYKEYSKMD